MPTQTLRYQIIARNPDAGERRSEMACNQLIEQKPRGAPIGLHRLERNVSALTYASAYNFEAQ
jgi:hypothetical protein